MISRIFSCKFLHIQIASVSGHSIHFIFKTCQIVAGTSMIHQFHEFFNLIFGGFLTFGTTVYCLLRSNNTKWNQKWKTESQLSPKSWETSFLKNEFVTLSFKRMKSNPVPTVKFSVAQPSTTKPKEFKWMGFKSHMMATMAKWREHDYLTDTTFHCVSFFLLFLRNYSSK